MNLEAQKLKQLGNNAYKKKDFANALKNYGKAIDQEPTEITYYLVNERISKSQIRILSDSKRSDTVRFG